MVCHGYGQLAPYFIKKFDPLDDGANLVVAPEGLSRFYLDTRENRIGASWMTKEDRLLDIKNHLEYLNQVFDQAIRPIHEKWQVKINLLGFSQGVATICRYAAQEQALFDKLILWSGTIPPDLNYAQARLNFRKAQVHLVRGDQDQYVDQVYLENQKTAVAKLEIRPEIKVLSGNHSLDPDVLRTLI